MTDTVLEEKGELDLSPDPLAEIIYKDFRSLAQAQEIDEEQLISCLEQVCKVKVTPQESFELLAEHLKLL